MNTKKERPLIFIYQDGFRQISLPPTTPYMRNLEIIQVTSCSDGFDITTNLPSVEAVNKLNQFQGEKVVQVFCDTNRISNDGIFKGAEIAIGEHGREVVRLNW